MNREYRGARYSTLMASDIKRDGIGLELHWHSGSQDQIVAEVFFSDETERWTVNTFDCDIPLELLEELIAEAKSRLGKTKPNQSLQTTIMAGADAAAQPPRQP